MAGLYLAYQGLYSEEHGICAACRLINPRLVVAAKSGAINWLVGSFWRLMSFFRQLRCTMVLPNLLSLQSPPESPRGAHVNPLSFGHHSAIDFMFAARAPGDGCRVGAVATRRSGRAAAQR